MRKKRLICFFIIIFFLLNSINHKVYCKEIDFSKEYYNILYEDSGTDGLKEKLINDFCTPNDSAKNKFLERICYSL